MTSAVTVQVNDFAADAIISQLLLLDSQDPSKVPLMIALVLNTVDNCPASHAATLLTCSDAVCLACAGHQALHKFAWWLSDCRHGHL